MSVAGERAIDLGPVFTETYRGESAQDAAEEFAEAAAELQRLGYQPSSQQWAGNDLTVVYQRPGRPSDHARQTASLTRHLDLTAIAILLGGAMVAMVAVGAVLPWITASTGFLTVSRSGLEGGGDGVITLVLGIAIALCGLGIAANAEQRLAAPATVGALVVLIVLALDYQRLRDLIDSAGSLSGLASIGVGWWVSAAGGLVALVSGVQESRR